MDKTDKPKKPRKKRDYTKGTVAVKNALESGLRLVVDNGDEITVDESRPAMHGRGWNKHGLTAKQERFASHVANGLSLAESYRRSYDAETMSPASIHRQASHLMDNSKVASRINALVAAKNTGELHDNARLRRLVIEALHAEATNKSNPASVRVRAMELLGKSVAAFVERVETKEIDADAAPEDIEAALKARLAALGNTG